MKGEALLRELWPTVAAVATIGASLAASVHVVLRKRDARAALAWLGFIWFVPLAGALAYVLLA